MPEQRKQPALVMLILALLGVFSLPQILKTPESSSPSGGPGTEASASSATSDSGTGTSEHPEHGDDDIRTLAPLIAYLSNGESRPATKDELAVFLGERLIDTNVYCLIVTLPDPVASVASARFDEYLDVVQRAIELQGYVLNRSRLPWNAAAAEKTAPDDTVTKMQIRGKDTPLGFATTAPTRLRKERQPGLLVFTHLIAPRPGSELKPPALFLTFLVPESPISGIDKHALVESIGLIDTYFRQYLTHNEANDKSFLHIIAPCFNSSQRSLEMAIAGSRPPSGRNYHFRIISSSAGLIHQDRLQKILGKESPHTLSFSSMVHEAKDLKDAIIGYLSQSLGYARSEIAVLVESNSGLAQALVQDERKKGVNHDFALELLPPLDDASRMPAKGTRRIILAEVNGSLHFRIFDIEGNVLADTDQQRLPEQRKNVHRLKARLQKLWPPGHLLRSNEEYDVISDVMSIFAPEGPPVEFLFPLQVSELRKAYAAKAGGPGGGQPAGSNTLERLSVPPNEAGAPRDLPRAFTPATSAALDELALTQVLTTIARRPYQAVGVAATDPFDVAFLAGEVGKFCPNVRLFTLSSDLLLARASTQVDLRGMIIASTYPLYPSNQWITTPFRDGPRVFFSNRGAQGLYNATVAHLWEMSADEPDDKTKPSSPQLLEFGQPYDIEPTALHQPPVWISAVGERGLYPITAIPARKQTPYLYDPRTAPEQRILAQWPAEKPAAQDPGPANPQNTKIENEELSEAQAEAASAIRPNPHLLFWLLCLFLFFACFLVAYLTWHYVLWSTDEQKYRRKRPFTVHWLRRTLDWLNCDVLEDCGEFKLSIMRGLSRAGSIPSAGTRTIIVAEVGGRLHFRGFDSTGRRFVELTEGALPRKAPQIKKLKSRLAAGGTRAVTDRENARFLRMVAGIVDRPWLAQGEFFDPDSKQLLDGDPYNPQRRFRDHQSNPHPPPVGAGINVALLNLLVCGISWCVYSQFIMAICPIAGTTGLSSIPIWVSIGTLALVSSSTAIAVLECFVRRPENEAARGPDRGAGSRHRFLPSAGLRPGATILWFTCAFALVIAAAHKVMPGLVRWKGITYWRLSFERFTSLPSGLSPIFPVLFLSVALAGWIYAQLAWRRLYRLSYLPSSESDAKQENKAAHFEQMLIAMRSDRGKVDRLLSQWWMAVARSNPVLWLVVGFLLVHMTIRFALWRLPGSFEGWRFDWIFWALFMFAFGQVVIRTLQLTSLWRCVRAMLHLAVQLPLAPAYDRIPARFKGWFFGGDDFVVREQLIRQHSTAVGNRITTKLIAIFDQLLDAFAADGRAEAFPCKPGTRLEPNRKTALTCRAALEELRGKLTTTETLESTREVYKFLGPLWQSFPVEGTPQGTHNDEKKAGGADWLDSWPVTPEQRKALSDEQFAMLRDWTRIAEDLIALQIVRWFAPALSHLLPMMQYVVLASISLLLVVTSYPFDHQGWLTTMMVCLIVLVGLVVATILLGVNRDELISRVANTAPGRLSVDGNFVSSVLTMVAPLIAALVAVSFDLSDLLRTWFGPLFQYF